MEVVIIFIIFYVSEPNYVAYHAYLYPVHIQNAILNKSNKQFKDPTLEYNRKLHFTRIFTFLVKLCSLLSQTLTTTGDLT